MARLVKDFDADCKDGNYIVKKEVGDGFPAVTVYDNRTGNESEYYGIFAKPIKKITLDKRYLKKGVYVLYI